MKNTKKIKKRMLVFSITIDPDLVKKALKYDSNFSRFTRDAIEMKIKYIEKKNKK